MGQPSDGSGDGTVESGLGEVTRQDSRSRAVHQQLRGEGRLFGREMNSLSSPGRKSAGWRLQVERLSPVATWLRIRGRQQLFFLRMAAGVQASRTLRASNLDTGLRSGSNVP